MAGSLPLFEQYIVVVNEWIHLYDHSNAPPQNIAGFRYVVSGAREGKEAVIAPYIHRMFQFGAYAGDNGIELLAAYQFVVHEDVTFQMHNKMDTSFTGKFIVEGETSVWTLVDEKGKEARVCVYPFPVLSRLLEYHVTGMVYGNVLYTRSVAMRVLPWSDHVSQIQFGVSSQLMDNFSRSKRPRAVVPDLNRWIASGFDDRVFFDPAGVVGEPSDLIRDVMRVSVERGKKGAEETDLGDTFCEADYAPHFDSGRLVLFNGEVMLREVYEAQDAIDSAVAAAGDHVTFIDGGSHVDVPGDHQRVLFRCELLDVAEAVTVLGEASAARPTVMVGTPDFASRHCVYHGRKPLPMQIAAAVVYPQAEVWTGKLGTGKGLYVSPTCEAFLAAEDAPVDLGVLVVTCDRGGIAKAHRLARRRGGMFARPTVGLLYRSRRTGRAAPLVSSPTHLAEFWKEFTPFDACFSYEIVPADVVVVVATYEVLQRDLKRAFDYAGRACVVVGATVNQVEKMFET